MIRIIENIILPEAEQIAAFYQKHYDAPDYIMPTRSSILASKRTYILYLGESEEILGISSLEPITAHLVGCHATVVASDSRGQGIGKKLNESIENYAKSQGFGKIKTNIYVDNVPSIVLKLKLGYEFEGRLMDHDEPGKHEYIMGKLL